MPEVNDGIYKVRTGNNNERLIQVPFLPTTHYWRYVNVETGEIRLVPVLSNSPTLPLRTNE